MSIIEETETTQQLYDDMVEDMILVSEGEYTFAATGWHVFNLDTRLSIPAEIFSLP